MCTYFSLYSCTKDVTITLNFSTPSNRSALNVGWIWSRWLATVPAYKTTNKHINSIPQQHEKSAVASCLVPSSPERAVQVPALAAGDIVLCSWTRHFTLTVPLSTQVYNDSVHSISLILLWNIEPKNYTSLVSKQTSEN